MKAPTKLPCKVAVWWIYHVLGLSSLTDHLRLSSCSFSHSHQLDAFTPTHSISVHVSPWTCTPHKVEGGCSKSSLQTLDTKSSTKFFPLQFFWPRSLSPFLCSSMTRSRVMSRHYFCKDWRISETPGWIAMKWYCRLWSSGDEYKWFYWAETSSPVCDWGFVWEVLTGFGSFSTNCGQAFIFPLPKLVMS